MARKKNIALAMMTSSLVLLNSGAWGEGVVTESLQEEALSYSDLGSGEEVRSDLVAQSKKTAGGCSSQGATGMTGATGSKSPGQGQCGQGKKPAQGQCGEGKCGSSSGNSQGGTSSYKKGTSKNSAGK